MRPLIKIQIVLIALVTMIAIPFSAYAVDGQRKISQTPSTTFPITINQSGSYVLTSNLVVTDPNLNAIEITTNDVTLNLNGHVIQGPHEGSPWGGSGSGIYALYRYNITITNGKVMGFGGAGINLFNQYPDPGEKGAGHCIDKIQANNNGTKGIVIFAGLVTNCTANNNGADGIEAHNSTLTNCTANNNLSGGIWGFSNSISHCTANYNSDGIIADSNSTISNCIAIGNGYDGITAIGSVIINCTANYNATDGIHASCCNRIDGNNIRSNGRYGIYIGSDENYVIKNTASGNTSANFAVNPGAGSNYYMPICGVDATDNCNYGF